MTRPPCSTLLLFGLLVACDSAGDRRTSTSRRSDSGPQTNVDAGFVPLDAQTGDALPVASDSGAPNIDASSGRDASAPNADAAAPDAVGLDAEASDSGPTVTSIASAIANEASLGSVPVRLEHVVVAATARDNRYPAQGTFFVQHTGAAGPGLAVYKSNTDPGNFPAVGDIVTITGHLYRYSGLLELEGSTSIPLEIVLEGTGGRVSGGAMPPAGGPFGPALAAEYDHQLLSAHSEQLGNVVSIAGPLSVTNPSALVRTDRDGGVRPQGFEVTSRVMINDTFVYRECISALPGGVLDLDLSRGIRGVWAQYQDYFAGSPSAPAPLVPVIYPTSCTDLAP
ncbi:MAG: hypothetical protein HYV07_19475 [Deltaproteobacteria bacterium]|nr:hypothetical protein [Deltaproteobacteria bacterium]